MKLGGFFARGVRGAVVAAALVGAGSAGAATLNVNASGILLGASGVDVGGTLYDVQFLDGTCSALFNGCDEVSDFAFTTEAAATMAAQALLDQVFVDGPLGAFDSRPELTNGCSNTHSCFAIIPHERISSNFFGMIIVSLQGVASNNLSGSTTDATQSLTLDVGNDTAPLSSRSFALFSLSPVTAVPVPAALPLLLGALGVLGLAGRRRRG